MMKRPLAKRPRAATIALAGLAALAGCSDSLSSREVTAVVQPQRDPDATGPYIREVLDDMVNLYVQQSLSNNERLIYVAEHNGSPRDATNLQLLTDAFRIAGNAHASISMYPDSFVRLDRSLVTIGNFRNNATAEIYARFEPKPFFHTYAGELVPPPSEQVVIQSFALPSGRHALAVVAERDVDRQRGIEALARELRSPGTYPDFNASAVRIFGNPNDPQDANFIVLRY